MICKYCGKPIKKEEHICSRCGKTQDELIQMEILSKPVERDIEVICVNNKKESPRGNKENIGNQKSVKEALSEESINWEGARILGIVQEEKRKNKIFRRFVLGAITILLFIDVLLLIMFFSRQSELPSNGNIQEPQNTVGHMMEKQEDK